MATENNEQELRPHSNDNQNNTLGNASQLVQANLEARHLYAQLLRNPDISGVSLATDPAYDRLTTLIYQTEPLEIIASAKGLRQGAASFENNVANTLKHPLDAISNIGPALEQALQNPKQTLVDFAYGNMQEREHLANIMEMDNPQQRLQEATAYYTEFYLNRATAMAGTMAGGKLISTAGKSSLAYVAETARQVGEKLPPTGGALVTEGTPLLATSPADTLTSSVKVQTWYNSDALQTTAGVSTISDDKGQSLEPDGYTGATRLTSIEQPEYGPATITGEEALSARAEYNTLSQLVTQLRVLAAEAKVEFSTSPNKARTSTPGVETQPGALFHVPDKVILLEGDELFKAELAQTILKAAEAELNAATTQLFKTQSIPNETAYNQLFYRGFLKHDPALRVSVESQRNVINRLLDNLAQRTDIPADIIQSGALEPSVRLSVSRVTALDLRPNSLMMENAIQSENPIEIGGANTDLNP